VRKRRGNGNGSNGKTYAGRALNERTGEMGVGMERCFWVYFKSFYYMGLSETRHDSFNSPWQNNAMKERACS
jgi:hypothetical protein